MRVIKNDYILDWENNRQAEIVSLTSKGTIPVYHDAETKDTDELGLTMEDVAPLLMGQACGPTNNIEPAKKIVHDMVNLAIATLRANTHLVQPTPSFCCQARLQSTLVESSLFCSARCDLD